MNIQKIYKLYQQHTTITTDSRDCPEGSIFIALKGASFDGNKFAKKALENGCSYAIIDDEKYAEEGNDKIILVEDALVAFKKIARFHRRNFHLPVIGITGTNGKTTSKELISAVLSEKYNVLHTEGNFNNDVGVPKTLLRLERQHEIAVIEMGASHQGDIKKLVEYVEPTCGLITNVGHAHLEGFGSFEGVKRTKGELYDYLKENDGLVFLNKSDEELTKMVTNRKFERVLTYGKDELVNFQGEIIDCAPFLHFRWREALGEWAEVKTHLVGTYNFDNIMAAIAIGMHNNVPSKLICHALENYIPSNNRSQLTETENNNLIVDAYNANPSSMAAAIENFRVMNVENKMAILGDMRELGSVTAVEHQKVVEQLKAAGLTNVWLVGENFEQTDTDFKKFPNVEAVKAEIAKEQPKNCYILIKGSNGIRLFDLPDSL